MQPIFVQSGFAAPIPSLLAKVGLKEETEEARDFAELARQLFDVAGESMDCGASGPGAVYVRTAVEYVGGAGKVVLGGKTLHSALLARNLLGAEWAYAHVATCGADVEAWADRLENTLQRYWADAIQQAMLEELGGAMKRDIEGRFGAGNLAFMGPGGVPGWALEGQRDVFRLLGEGAEKLGVQLRDDHVMRPLKSVSGILFPSRDGWCNCSHCEREGCPSRRSSHGCGRA